MTEPNYDWKASQLEFLTAERRGGGDRGWRYGYPALTRPVALPTLAGLWRPRGRSGELSSGRGATTPPPSLFCLRAVVRRPRGGPRTLSDPPAAAHSQPSPRPRPRRGTEPSESRPVGEGKRGGPREQRGTWLREGTFASLSPLPPRRPPTSAGAVETGPSVAGIWTPRTRPRTRPRRGAESAEPNPRSRAWGPEHP